MPRLKQLDAFCTRHRLLFGLLSGAVLTLVLFLWNLHGGPLYNLNDIGTWQNRLLFTAFSAVVEMTLFAACAVLCRASFSRLLLRQGILAAGHVILLLAMNQKTFAYVTQVQPIIRAMDTYFLQDLGRYNTNLSAPALTLLCLISRGPIYDMYLVKLFAIACYELLSLILCERVCRGKDRYEAVLLLMSILPQGFLSSACAAQTDVFAVLLCALAMTVPKGKGHLSLILLGAAGAMSSVMFLMIPLYLYLFPDTQRRQLLLVPVTAAVLTLPAMLFGMSPLAALASLFRANTALPMAGSGTGTVFGFFPRAQVTEIPQYYLLRPLTVDEVTLSAGNYTQTHFVLLMRGLTLAALALGMGLFALERGKENPPLRRALILSLIPLVVTPSLSQGAWLGVCLLALAGLLLLPRDRVPLCILLFATAGGCCYPVTGEMLLAPALLSALCLLSLALLMGILEFGKQG